MVVYSLIATDEVIDHGSVVLVQLENFGPSCQGDLGPHILMQRLTTTNSPLWLIRDHDDVTTGINIGFYRFR